MVSEQYYIVGKIANTHGLRGELKILPQTDFTEERFASGSELYLTSASGNMRTPVEVTNARRHKNMYIVRFAQFTDINEVEQYKGGSVLIAGENREPLPEGEYYYNEIIGCQVITDEDEQLGEITDIITTGANDVWVVTPDKGKDILLPVIDDVILAVDVQAKRVKVHLMEGLV